MSIRREIADLLFPIPQRQDRDLDGYIGMAAQFLTPFCIVHEQLSSYRIHANNMGGLTEPTPQRLRYELHLIELRTATLKQFVNKRLGEKLAGANRTGRQSSVPPGCAKAAGNRERRPAVTASAGADPSASKPQMAGDLAGHLRCARTTEPTCCSLDASQLPG